MTHSARPDPHPPAGAQPARPATGQQFELHRGQATARIGQVAAVLREFSVDGVHYTPTWPDSEPTPKGCGMVLMPWPNRVAHGRWRHGGAERQLDITEPTLGHAIHGLLRNTAYQPVDRTEASVTLAASVYPQHGWPFTLDTSVTYELTDAGLHVIHTVTNVGTGPALFGCGAHPYLQVGDVPAGDLTLTVRAARYLVTDDAMIPIDSRPLTGELAALPTGARVADLDLDIGLEDLTPVDGRIEHSVRAPDGRGLRLWADPVFAWAQVFTPRTFPSPAGPRQAVAIEPMTCPADALNSGRGLITLRPRERWAGSWGLSPFAG